MTTAWQADSLPLSHRRECCYCSVVSGSLQLQGLQPSRLLTILLNSRLYRGKYTYPRRPQREANISKMWQDERAEASFGGSVPPMEAVNPRKEKAVCYIKVQACMLSHFSCIQLFATPWTVALQAPLPTGFSRQEHWSGLSCSPPAHLADPGIKSASLMSHWIYWWVLYH